MDTETHPNFAVVRYHNLEGVLECNGGHAATKGHKYLLTDDILEFWNMAEREYEKRDVDGR